MTHSLTTVTSEREHGIPKPSQSQALLAVLHSGLIWADAACSLTTSLHGLYSSRKEKKKKRNGWNDRERHKIEFLSSVTRYITQLPFRLKEELSSEALRALRAPSGEFLMKSNGCVINPNEDPAFSEFMTQTFVL